MKLELTTTLAPTTPVSVDGEDYNILGLDHLSPDEEAEAMALFARLENLSMRLSREENFTKQKQIASTVRKTRLDILARLTDIPRSVTEKLPVGAQAALLDAIGEVMNGETEEKEQEDDGGTD